MEHEPDNGAGGPIDAAGETAEVEIVSVHREHGAAGVTVGGNFMLESVKLVFPITAGVRFRGRERWMVTRQETGDCNMCHSVDGRAGAPGRIQLP